MKSLLLLLFSSFFFLSSSISQEYRFGFQTGYGDYSMTGLKEFMKIVASETPFESQVVDNFPGYVYYRPSVSAKFGKFGIGINYTYQSTGARVSAKDYSANYYFDAKIKANCYSIVGEYDFLHLNKACVSLYSNIGLVYSDLQMIEYFSLAPFVDESKQNYNFKAYNYSVEPGINLTYPVFFLLIQANLGYSFSLGENAFEYEGSLENGVSPILRNPSNGKEIYPEWSGVRAGISIIVPLN